MKILTDTNILISALFYPDSKPANALYHAANNYELVLCDQNVTELRRIAKEKFSNKQADIDIFLAELSYEIIPAIESSQKLINDPEDAPILNAAIASNIDLIISGDKHFKSLNLAQPKTMTADEYLKIYKSDDS